MSEADNKEIGAGARTWDCGAEPGTVAATLGDDGTLTVSGAGSLYVPPPKIFWQPRRP
jgi:hypothetical protein